MSFTSARWRKVRTFVAFLLLPCSMGMPQSPVVPLLPVQEAPQLLPVPKVQEGSAPAASVAPSVPFSSGKTPSSTSVSKQFTVYGGDLTLRSSFCMLCEETATALGRVLKDNGKYVLPVIVVLKTPPDITVTGPAVTYNIGELAHGGFHLQINAQLRTGFNTTEFSNELVRILLAERILRNHQKLQTSRSDVLPAWVMTGVTQALDFRSRSRPSALFSAVFRRGQVYSLDRILAADPTHLDALSKGIYETSTCALVLTLLDMPDGAVRFAKFLNALAVESKSDRELLTMHFPSLGSSQNALEKWWSLQMAALAMPSAMETYGLSRTEEELDDALMLMLPGNHEEKKEAVPTMTATEAEAKKPGNKFFNWFKRDDKSDAPAEAGKKDAAKPQEEAKPKEEAPSQPAEEAKPEGSKPFFRFPGSSLLPGGKKVVFPFGKKKPVDEAADAPADEKDKGKEEKKKPEPAKPEPKAEPAKKSQEPAKTVEAPPPAKLSRKPGESRSIGGRPEDLPKAPPAATPPPKKDTPVEAPKKPEKEKASPTEGKPEDSAPEKPNMFNPRNWFRKDDQASADAKEKDKGTSAGNKAGADAGATPARKRTVKPGSIPIEDFAMIAKHPDRVDILNRCMAKLSALKLKAHPMYKPIVTDYILVVQELVQGKTKGVSDRLERLRQQRDETHEKALAVESYLDWYEANHTGTLSHSFDDFLKLDEELSRERLPRNDALSKYLDAVQQEFEEK